MAVIKGITSSFEVVPHGSVYGTTNASTIAPYVKEGLYFSHANSFSVDIPKQMILWVHFYYYCTISSFNYTLLEFYDTDFSETQPLFRVHASAGLQVWDGAAWVNLAPINMNSDAHLNRHDIKLDIADTGEFSYHRDGLPDGSFQGDTLRVSTTGVNRIRFYNGHGSQHYTSIFSDIIIADEETIDMKLVQGTLTGAGAVNEWSGSYTDVDEVLATSDMITSDAPGELFLATKDPFPTTYGEVVKALIISEYARTLGTGPTGVEGVVRVGTTDYAADPRTLTDTYTGGHHKFLTNPATGLPWTLDEINTAEIGLRSRD